MSDMIDISPGEHTVTFTIQTFADDLAESTELFWVYFAQGYNVNFTTPPHAFVRILDVPPGQ